MLRCKVEHENVFPQVTETESLTYTVAKSKAKTKIKNKTKQKGGTISSNMEYEFVQLRLISMYTMT